MSAAGELPDRSLYEHRQIAKPLVDPVLQTSAKRGWVDPRSPAVGLLREADPDTLRSVVITLYAAMSAQGVANRVAGIVKRQDLFAKPEIQLASYVLQSLGGRRPPFTRNDVRQLLEMTADIARRTDPSEDYWLGPVLTQPVSAAERAVRAGGLAELERPIRDLAKALGSRHGANGTEIAKRRARLVALVDPAVAAGDAPGRVPSGTFSDADTWGQVWAARSADMTGPPADAIMHCARAEGVVPSKAWRSRAAQLGAAEGVPALLAEILEGVVGSSPTTGGTRWEWAGADYQVPDPEIASENVLIVRGLIWMAASLPDEWVDGRLTEIGLYFGTSRSGNNVARDERLANTAAAALGTRGTTGAIGGLGRLKARVTNRNVTKQIVKALDTASASSGMSSSELLELAVSTEGLDADGQREIAVDGYAAVIALDGDDVSLTWRAPDGAITKSVPAAIADRKAEVNKVKEAVKELRKAVAIERGRIEDLFTEDRAWPLAEWRTRYLEHPVTGTIARRLIWRLVDGGTSVTVLPVDGILRDARGGAVNPSDSATVQPWHPISAVEGEVAAWRTRIVELRLRQPFKQAFREVYVLTPAEEQTELYSNRFAAHILRYPQARALMTARRWGSNFLGPFDGGYNGIAKREFRTHGIRAEFWHDAIDEDDLLPVGAVAFCATDQVRFVRTGRAADLVPLRDVPPVVLSEAMRDVDLFVAVTSIGADRNWQDRGINGNDRFDEYWAGYGRLPLTASAAVRHDALERMLPGLAIADRLTLHERSLEVRGDLHTYRIHLTSGNIFILPWDRYLCIVPARGGASEKVFLPFDDDPTLSVILSKAFLLAQDRKISDPTILLQLRDN